MQRPTIDDYLAYSPPRPVVAQSHTSHKTAVPSNPRTDDIELTEWEPFASNALRYADQIRHGPLGGHEMRQPLPKVVNTMPEICAEVDLYTLMGRYVIDPLESLTKVVFDKSITLGSGKPLLCLNPNAALVCFPAGEMKQKDALCAIEYKTPWALPSDCKIPNVAAGDLVAAFNAERAQQQPDPHLVPLEHFTIEPDSRDETKITRAVAQIWGYMTVNHLKYGILTTFNDTYFFRRVQRHTDTASQLEVSPCVQTGQGPLSFMSAWLYLISLAVESHIYTTPSNSSMPFPKAIEIGNPYCVQEIALSDIQFIHSSSLSTSIARANIGSMHQPHIVHVKFFDVTKVEDAAEKFQLELAAYQRLEPLQGKTIPKLYASFLAAGFLYGLFLEPCGEPISQQVFENQASAIKKLLAQIHVLGVAHCDVAPRNVLVNHGEMKLIDFDHCSLQTADMDPEIWRQLVSDDFDAWD